MSRRERKLGVFLICLFFALCLGTGVFQPFRTGERRRPAPPSGDSVFLANNVIVTPITNWSRLGRYDPARGRLLTPYRSPVNRGESQLHQTLVADPTPSTSSESRQPHLVPAPATSTPLRSVEPTTWRGYYLDLIDTSYRHSAEMRPGYQPIVP